MQSRVARFLLRLLLALAIAALGTWGISAAWIAIGGGPLSIHGQIALTIGILGTVGLSWILMSLAFRSDSEGWDDQVDNARDPGRVGRD